MKHTFKPESLKGPYDDDAEYQYLIERAKWAILLKVTITLDEYDSWGHFELSAWQQAYIDIMNERNG